MGSDPGSPLSPGVIESTSLLEDTIKDIAQSPSLLDSESTRSELLRLYDLARHGAGNATLSRCLRVIKDQNEGINAKLAVMKVLDYLMEVKQGILADAVARELKFFASLAKKTKEKEKRKRRPSTVFSSKASAEDIDAMLQATLELLDRWGRHFEADPGHGGGAQIAAARKDLMKEQVRFPDPRDYRHLTLTPASATASAFNMRPASATAGERPEMSEAQLQAALQGLQEATARFGAEAPEAAEAKATFESTLASWQRAAEEAVERNDFEAFERLSEVSHRYAEMQSRIDSPPPSVSTEASHSRAASPPDSDVAELSSERRRRRRKAQEKGAFEQSSFGGDWAAPSAQPPPPGAGAGAGAMDPEQARATYRSGAFGGSFGLNSFAGFGGNVGSGEFGAGFGGGPGVPVDFSAASDGFGATGGEGMGAADGLGGMEGIGGMGGMGTMGGVGDFNAGDAFGFPAHPSGASEVPSEGTPAFGTSFGGLGSATDEAPPGEPQSSGSDMEMMRQLCGKLSAEIQQLKAQQPEESERLQAATRRIKELEAQGGSGKDLTITALRESNMQLQSELDARCADLANMRKRAQEAERRLAEKDEVFSETCQRLLDAQQRVAQLEEDLAAQAEVEKSLQQRLEGAREQQTAKEVELRQVRHALSSAAGWSTDTVRRSNVPYGSTSILARVNQADELASSFTEASRRSEEDLPPTQPASLARSSAETWAQTPRIWQPLGALVRRLPPSHDLALKAAAHFRELLGKPQGILYEDHQVVLALKVSPNGRHLDLEALLSNRSGQQIHDVKLQPAADAHGVASRFALQLEPQVARPLGPSGQLHFRGRLEVFGVVDSADGGPQVDLAYLQPDNQGLRARLRLPLASKLLAAADKALLAARALQLWDAPDFVHAEVACICKLRPALAQNAAFFAWQALELGGALRCLPGVGGFRAALFAGCYPSGNESDVLLRAELGPAPGESAATARGAKEELCRVAVRSSSALVNRAVAQAAIDVLCDPAR